MTAGMVLQDLLNSSPRPLINAKQLCGPLLWSERRTVHQLPNELLSYIFFIATHDYESRFEAIPTPTIISHVCSRWRHTILSTGSLWTDLIFTHPFSNGQLSHAETWLSRSRTYPLDILLDLRDPYWDFDETSHSFKCKDLETILKLLSTHSARWHRLELLADTWAHVFTFLWYTCRVVSAPCLRTISLSRCNAYFASKGETFQPVALKRPIPLFGGLVMDKLREVALVGVHVDWTKSSLRNLSELELKYHALDVMPSLKQFVDILTSCPDLHDLSIIGWGPQFGTGGAVQTQGSSAPSSLAADANAKTLRNAIRLVHLKRFSFGFLDTQYALDLLSLFCFPAMEELRLEDVSLTMDLLEPQDGAPILEWLTHGHKSKHFDLQSSHGSDFCPSAFPLGHVRSLQLSGIHSDEATSSHFLHEFNDLRRLRLFHTSDDVLRALAPPPVSSEPTEHHVPCSLLKELECQDVDPSTLIDVVTSRAKVTSISPFERASLGSGGGGLCTTTAEKAKLADAGIEVVGVLTLRA